MSLNSDANWSQWKAYPDRVNDGQDATCSAGLGEQCVRAARSASGDRQLRVQVI
jgi:hypothetical protein